jgi:hypothetical protein
MRTVAAMPREFVLLIAAALAVGACQPIGESPGPAVSPPPSLTAIATPAPASTTQALPGPVPQSAGTVPDAGILYLLGADDAVYRYDGATGHLDVTWGGATLDRVVGAGPYVAGRQGGLTLLRWDGTTEEVACGSGRGDRSPSGACVSSGPDGVFIQVPGASVPRLELPPDWGAGSAQWSPTADRLLLIRTIRPRPGPGMDPGQSALWVRESDGRLRELYRPRGQGVLANLRWSPDGKSALVWRIGTTSNSLAADGVETAALLVDIDTANVTDLGVVMSTAPQWGPDGRLAFIRGAGRMTWEHRELVVRGVDGRERVIAPSDASRVALLPAWDPAGGRLAWVSGPSAPGSGNGDGYVDGFGAGQRVAVIDNDTSENEVRCGEGRVVEGVRWSTDGTALLLLCRKPGGDARPLELWLYRFRDGSSTPLVRGLVGVPSAAGGFGFYGAQPSLFSIVAWSRAPE